MTSPCECMLTTPDHFLVLHVSGCTLGDAPSFFARCGIRQGHLNYLGWILLQSEVRIDLIPVSVM